MLSYSTTSTSNIVTFYTLITSATAWPLIARDQAPSDLTHGLIAGSACTDGQRSRREENIFLGTRNQSFPLSLLSLGSFPRGLLIPLDGTPAVPCENTILLESLVRGVRAYVRARARTHSLNSRVAVKLYPPVRRAARSSPSGRRDL